MTIQKIVNNIDLQCWILKSWNLTRNYKVKYDQTIKCLTRLWNFERSNTFLQNRDNVRGDFPLLQMPMSYRDISRWATIRIVSRCIDTVSIYRHIVSSLTVNIRGRFTNILKSTQGRIYANFQRNFKLWEKERFTIRKLA